MEGQFPQGNAAPASMTAGVVDLLSSQGFLTALVGGLIVLVIFARDRFNRPAYDAKAIVPFTLLPPNLLAPEFRYREGLRLYVYIIGGFYLVASLAAPLVAKIPNFGIAASGSERYLWPIVVAAALAGISALDDKSALGRIESKVRQLAQEFAFIPFELAILARRLRATALDEPGIAAADGTDGPRVKIATERLLAPAVLDAGQRRELFGDDDDWRRAAVVIQAIENLERDARATTDADPQFEEFRSQIETKRKAIREAVAIFQEKATLDRARLQELQSDIDALLRIGSMYLAAFVFRNAATRGGLTDLLASIGYHSVYSTRSGRRLDFVVGVSTATIGGGVLAVLVVLLVNFPIAYVNLPDLPFGLVRVDGPLRHEAIWKLAIGFVSAIMLYGVAFVAAFWLREVEIRRRSWEESPGYRLKKLWILSIGVGGALLGANILLVGTITIEWVVTFCLFTVPIAWTAMWFFLVHMRDAAGTVNLPAPAASMSVTAASGPGMRQADSPIADAPWQHMLADYRAALAAFFAAPSILPLWHGVAAAVLAGGLSFGATYFNMMASPKLEMELLVNWLDTVDRSMRVLASPQAPEDEKPDISTALRALTSDLPHITRAVRMTQAELGNVFILHSAKDLGAFRDRIGQVCERLTKLWVGKEARPSPVHLFHPSGPSAEKQGARAPGRLLAGRCSGPDPLAPVEADAAPQRLAQLAPAGADAEGGPAAKSARTGNVSGQGPSWAQLHAVIAPGLGPLAKAWVSLDMASQIAPDAEGDRAARANSPASTAGGARSAALRLDSTTRSPDSNNGTATRSEHAPDRLLTAIAKGAGASALISALMALSFSVAVRSWRQFQLNHAFDAADEVRQHEAWRRYQKEKACGEASGTWSEWLSERPTKLSGITRLEAMQYDEYEDIWGRRRA